MDMNNLDDAEVASTIKEINRLLDKKKRTRKDNEDLQEAFDELALLNGDRWTVEQTYELEDVVDDTERIINSSLIESDISYTQAIAGMTDADLDAFIDKLADKYSHMFTGSIEELWDKLSPAERNNILNCK